MISSFTIESIFLAVIFIGLGKSIVDPVSKVFIGSIGSLKERNRSISLMETSWAISSLIGIPILGLVLNTAGWNASFFVLLMELILNLLLVYTFYRKIDLSKPANINLTSVKLFGLIPRSCTKKILKNKKPFGIPIIAKVSANHNS